jgi:purine-binding chemotaxis protein CheW
MATMVDEGIKGMQVLTFQLDVQEYALNIADVVQVVRMVAITKTPNAPAVVAGVVNMRGRVIPVVNLRRRFSMPDKVYGVNDQLLITRVDRNHGDGNGRILALIVDTVKEVLTIPAADLDELAANGGRTAAYLSAIGKLNDRLLLILDPETLFTAAEEQQLTGLINESPA